MPSIISVALAIGVRRLLSQENIYTIKLVGRGHLVPKALHANMFLVRRAGEVMERDVILLPAEENFGSFLRQQAGATAGFRHVVVTRGNHIVGFVRVNIYEGVRLGDIAQRNYTLARETDIMFDVVQRMARRDASMVVVVKSDGRGRLSEMIGIISNEHVADFVAESIKPFSK